MKKIILIVFFLLASLPINAKEIIEVNNVLTFQIDTVYLLRYEFDLIYLCGNIEGYGRVLCNIGSTETRRGEFDDFLRGQYVLINGTRCDSYSDLINFVQAGSYEINVEYITVLNDLYALDNDYDPFYDPFFWEGYEHMVAINKCTDSDIDQSEDLCNFRLIEASEEELIEYEQSRFGF